MVLHASEALLLSKEDFRAHTTEWRRKGVSVYRRRGWKEKAREMAIWNSCKIAHAPLQTRCPDFLKQEQVTLAGSVALLSPCPRHKFCGKVGAPSLDSMRRRAEGCPHDSGLRKGLFCRNNHKFHVLQGSWSCPTEILESDWERVLTLPLKLRIHVSQVVRGCKGFPLFAWRVMFPDWRVLLLQEGGTAPVQERHVAFVFLHKRGSFPCSPLSILRSRIMSFH